MTTHKCRETPYDFAAGFGSIGGTWVERLTLPVGDSQLMHLVPAS